MVVSKHCSQQVEFMIVKVPSFLIAEGVYSHYRWLYTYTYTYNPMTRTEMRHCTAQTDFSFSLGISTMLTQSQF